MRIQNKLFVAFLLTGVGLVGLMLVLMQWSLSKGLLEFVNSKERDAIAPAIEKLTQEYQQHGDWQWIKGRHRLFHRIFRNYTNHTLLDSISGKRPVPPPPPPQGNGGPRPPPPPPRAARAVPDFSLFDANKQFLVGKEQVSDNDHWLAIELSQQVVGYLVIPRRLGLTKGYELALLEQQRHQFLLISLLLIVLTAIIAMPLARHLVQPIKRLAQSMAQLTSGNYQERIEIKRNDELGHLARDVNELAMTLDKNDSARRRWLANISHELRTPIAVLKSEMEAVIDDIRPLNKDFVHSSYQETQRLQRLVEDLYELTSADIGGMKYRKQSINLKAFLQQESDHFIHLLAPKNISYVQHIADSMDDSQLVIWGDCDRLSQLFNNLMVNCGKYASAQGRVELSLNYQDGNIIIRIDDDGPGVPSSHLPLLFEHLYRVDDSRDRQTGGSGLGLAICKQIVEAHQGQIVAQKSALGGLAVVITLPSTSA